MTLPDVDDFVPRICTACDVRHVENCPSCFGFGLKAKPTSPFNVPIIAAEVSGIIPLPEWAECEICHGTPSGTSIRSQE